MKKGVGLVFLLLFVFLMSSFDAHKFYMAIYQVNYAPEKKMLQVTTRIFADDLNKALEKKYNQKTFLGSDKDSPESIELLKKYLADKFTIKVNGISKPMSFLSKEMDGDVLVCYLKITDVSKIRSLEIYNAILIECHSEQQNILHFSAFGDKKSFLFTESTTKEVLNY